MDESRALRREVRRLEFELRAVLDQVPLLRAMVNGGRDGLAILDGDGTVLECNSAFADMVPDAEGPPLGARLPRLLPSADGDGPLWPPPAAPEPSPRIARAAAAAAREAPEEPALLEILIAPVGDEAAKRWVVNARRLTEATLQARALHEARRRVAALTAELDAQRRYAVLFEHSTEALLLVGAEGSLLQRNPLAARWWPTLAAGRSLAEELPALAPHVARCCAPTGSPAEAAPPAEVSVEWREARPEGERFLLATVASVAVGDGRGALLSVRDITAHRQAERALSVALDEASAALAEREVLLKEVHHRVKNNLQIVSSLLSMQSDRAPPEAQRALADSTLRIRSMALIHEVLYGGDDLARVELGAYVSRLAHELRAVLAPTSELCVDVSPLELALDRAIPAGLLLNELLTNAFKHGRSADGRCRVTVRLTRPEPGRAILGVQDEGPGLPGIAGGGRPTTLGKTLIAALARQLGATLSTANAPGATVTLAFSVNTPEGAGSSAA